MLPNLFGDEEKNHLQEDGGILAGGRI